ncbi:MAG: hypothetical protein CR972_03640 [Candidatus Moraniibacteriota bacterium]|nr:MAG: hypothetical protein CR972_03640 [Candidatus Moranbacteria bacterium]
MMSGLIYQDQSADDLQLCLVQGRIQKEKLSILCTDSIIGDGIYLEIGIIGASHFWQLIDSFGTCCLAEVFSCVQDYSFAGKNKTMIFTLSDAKNISKTFDHISYHFHSEKKTVQSGKRKMYALIDKIQSSALLNKEGEAGLMYTFPQIDERDIPPTTVVCAMFDPYSRGITVETIHAYPNEDAIVFTKTMLEGE